MTNERRRRAHQSGGCFTIDKIQERGINAVLRVIGSAGNWLTASAR